MFLLFCHCLLTLTCHHHHMMQPLPSFPPCSHALACTPCHPFLLFSPLPHHTFSHACTVNPTNTHLTITPPTSLSHHPPCHHATCLTIIPPTLVLRFYPHFSISLAHVPLVPTPSTHMLPSCASKSQDLSLLMSHSCASSYLPMSSFGSLQLCHSFLSHSSNSFIYNSLVPL
jgi:hypothetical protein